jgi:hypothetical protein
VLGVAGLQRCLLGQVQCLDPRVGGRP